MNKSKKLKRKTNKNKISRKKHNPIQTSKRVKRVKIMRMKGGNALKIKVYNRLINEIETKINNYYFPRVSLPKESSNPIITGSNLEQVNEKELELLHMYIELLIIKHFCLKEINNYDKKVDDEFIAKLNHLIIYKIDYLLGEIDKKMDNVFMREFIGQNDVYNIKKYIESDFDNNVFNGSKQNNRVKTKIDKIKTEIEQKIQGFKTELSSGTNPEEIFVEMSDENDIVNPLFKNIKTNKTNFIPLHLPIQEEKEQEKEQEEKEQEPELEEQEPELEEEKELNQELEEQAKELNQEEVKHDYKIAMNKFTRKMRRTNFQNPKIDSLLSLLESNNGPNQLTEEEQAQFMNEYKQLGFRDSITNSNQLLNDKKFIRLFNSVKTTTNMLPNVYNYNRQQTTRKRTNM
jgi:hypothetical protein